MPSPRHAAATASACAAEVTSAIPQSPPPAPEGLAAAPTRRAAATSRASAGVTIGMPVSSPSRASSSAVLATASRSAAPSPRSTAAAARSAAAERSRSARGRLAPSAKRCSIGPVAPLSPLQPTSRWRPRGSTRALTVTSPRSRRNSSTPPRTAAATSAPLPRPSWKSACAASAAWRISPRSWRPTPASKAATAAATVAALRPRPSFWPSARNARVSTTTRARMAASDGAAVRALRSAARTAPASPPPRASRSGSWIMRRVPSASDSTSSGPAPGSSTARTCARRSTAATSAGAPARTAYSPARKSFPGALAVTRLTPSPRRPRPARR